MRWRSPYTESSRRLEPTPALESFVWLLYHLGLALACPCDVVWCTFVACIWQLLLILDAVLFGPRILMVIRSWVPCINLSLHELRIRAELASPKIRTDGCKTVLLSEIDKSWRCYWITRRLSQRYMMLEWMWLGSISFGHQVGDGFSWLWQKWRTGWRQWLKVSFWSLSYKYEDWCTSPCGLYI